MRAARTTALWMAAGSTVLTGCEINGLYDVDLPGGAASDGNAYHVTAEFRDVLDLVPQSAVKVNNVTVGAVEKVELNGWRARVRLRIEDSVKLPGNAIAELRQTSMLGEKYVSLAKPTDVRPSGRLTDGARIPVSRSNRTPEIEEVLSALSALLNGGGVAQLHTITKELNNTMEGREDKIKSVLSELDTFIGGLDSQRSEIIRAMKGIERLSKTLRQEKTTIGQAVDTMPSALKILADQRRNLTRMLQSLSKLSKVGTRVIDESGKDAVANLRALQPILGRLNEARNDLPNALELLTTYPFPRNSVDAIKGDYTNLHITTDLDLNSIYGNVTDDPKKPGKPSPNLPGLPGEPDLPKAPDAPDVPDLPGPDVPSPGPQEPEPSPPTGGNGLCPPVCTSSYAAYGGGHSGLPYGADPALAQLMTKGMQA
ncbi:MCE family protein [Streptomyces sp. 8N706]|uniref:MCE family protein n=1 Tax=Streptomyces sp. 8N706 TaxID=3457416 RepID=UPI003FCF1B4F